MVHPQDCSGAAGNGGPVFVGDSLVGFV